MKIIYFKDLIDKKQYRRKVEKEDMRICISYKCPNFSFGTCNKIKCKLKKIIKTPPMVLI
jgi:hypothetical protein